jgi:hypothetical protein
MTDEERAKEGEEEPIEDLEAPADAQQDVAGGKGCGQPSVRCDGDTCALTVAQCMDWPATHDIIVYEQ